VKLTEQPRSGWYGGTWPRKSTPSTKVARESILADKSNAAIPSVDFTRFEPKKPESQLAQVATRPPSMNIGKGQETIDTSLHGTDTLAEGPNNSSRSLSESVAGKEIVRPLSPLIASSERAVTFAGLSETTDKELQRPTTSSGWLGWFGKSNSDANISSTDQHPDIGTSPPSKPDELPASLPEMVSQAHSQPAPAGWFNLWPSAGTTIPINNSRVKEPSEPAKEDSQTSEPAAGNYLAPEPENPPGTVPGSSWAFWSRETSKGGDGSDVCKESVPSAEQGTLAITGQPSQNHPEPAQTPIIKDAKTGKKKSKSDGLLPNADETSPPQDSIPDRVSKPQEASSSKIVPPNLLLPTFKSTYRLKDNPSILQQLARLIMHNQQPPTKHVFLIKDPPKIKRALAIGVHGLFPAPLLRTVIGQPTGTSVRFANHAASAIHRWADQHGCECEIEKVALEGEGKIAERVDNLWKLLLNWIDHVRNADFILIACHSQGVPVTLMLVAKLIEFGVVTTGKIGICAMGE
jgi:hypothetical protein